MITKSIITILQLHTSLLSLHVSAHAITSLIAEKFGDDDLHKILNVQLNTLAISAQARQGIIPALVGIAKLTELQSWEWDNAMLCLTACTLIVYQRTHASVTCSARISVIVVRLLGALDLDVSSLTWQIMKWLRQSCLSQFVRKHKSEQWQGAPDQAL